MPWLDPDLAAVAVCCDWDVDWRDVVAELRDMHAKGVTLTDLCGHWLAFDILDKAADDEVEIDGPLRVMEALRVFTSHGLSEDLTGAFAVFKTAMSEDWYFDAADVTEALKRVEGLASEHAEELGPWFEDGSDVKVPQVTTALVWLRKTAMTVEGSPGATADERADSGTAQTTNAPEATGTRAAEGARRRVAFAVLGAGLALAAARFCSVDADERGAGNAGLTATETAYAALRYAGRSLEIEAARAALTGAEAAAVRTARYAADTMRKILGADEARLAEMDRILADWSAAEAQDDGEPRNGLNR
jgi:hypothetical protein